jgi:hypothetical protein
MELMQFRCRQAEKLNNPENKGDLMISSKQSSFKNVPFVTQWHSLKRNGTARVTHQETF